MKQLPDHGVYLDKTLQFVEKTGLWLKILLLLRITTVLIQDFFYFIMYLQENV